MLYSLLGVILITLLTAFAGVVWFLLRSSIRDG